MSDKVLGIVIPVWNNWNYTKRALQDLLKLPKDHVIIVVDNGSTDETKDLTDKGFDGKVVVHRFGANLGFAKACNAGFAVGVDLGFENIMFLNNDIRVLKDHETWTQGLISSARKGFIVGPTVGCLDEKLAFVCEASKWPTRGYGYLSGWNITASVETWNKLVIEDTARPFTVCPGPFSTEFGLAYFEDTDMGLRAREQKIPCEVVSVPVNHFGKATSTKLGLSGLYLHAKPIFLKKWEGRV